MCPRYLPVSTPRPSGAQANRPSPASSTAGMSFGFRPSLQQRVLRLACDQGEARYRRGLGGLPACEVRHTRIPGAACAHCKLKGGQRLLQGDVGIPCLRKPDIDIVRAEPGEAGVQAGQHRRSARYRRSAGRPTSRSPLSWKSPLRSGRRRHPAWLPAGPPPGRQHRRRRYRSGFRLRRRTSAAVPMRPAHRSPVPTTWCPGRVRTRATHCCRHNAAA